MVVNMMTVLQTAIPELIKILSAVLKMKHKDGWTERQDIPLKCFLNALLGKSA
jgi:hypothetical protein